MKMHTKVFSLPLKVLLAIAPILLAGYARANELLADSQPSELSQAASKIRLFAPLTDGVDLEPTDVVAELPSPSAFLGYPLGQKFTHHARQLAYLEALDTASDRVTTFEYGVSYQGRPLRLLVLSSPANLARLEELRLANLKLADPAAWFGFSPNGPAPLAFEELKRNQPGVVWLAFGVHGNETASPEAAMAIAYRMAAAPPGSELADVLEQTVILLDPMVNPDGHERYATFFNNAVGTQPDLNPRALEHNEPWPSGRSNHFLVDLNRDWAWMTQKETQARLAAYRSWEPHVYVDFHEMGYEQTYFFPPAAQPVHPLLEGNAQEWLELFGRANAAEFDQLSWLYFIQEEYDLLYPGYGDTYPSLRGAIGMTYEVGGGGRAGLAVELASGEVKTLADRVARHYTTGLATLRAAATHRRDLVRDFAERRSARLPERTYLFAADQLEAAAMVELLVSHGIEVRALGQATQLRVESLMPAGEVERTFPAGTYAVSVRQPLGRLLRALMDTAPSLQTEFVERQEERVEEGLEAEIYDITGWSLPLAYNVETWIFQGEISGLKNLKEPAEVALSPGGIGYWIPPQGLTGYRLAMALLDQGLRLRFVGEAVGGDPQTRGAFFVPRMGQANSFDQRILTTARRLGARIDKVTSSWQDIGPSLGSGKLKSLRAPKIGLIGGVGVDIHSHGFAWQLFDETLGLRISRLEASRLDDNALTGLDVVVFPDGNYSTVPPTFAETLRSFTRSGGRVVGIGGAIDWLRSHSLTSVQAWVPGSHLVEDPEEPGAKRKEQPLPLPGAVLATEIPGHHGLTAGLATPPPWLVNGDRILKITGDPRVDVLKVRRDDPLLAGLLWAGAAPRLTDALLVAREELGRGDVVIFAQEPNFRAYWRGTMPIFLNAVLGVD